MIMTVGNALDEAYHSVKHLVTASTSVKMDKNKVCDLVDSLFHQKGRINKKSVSTYIRLLDELLVADVEHHLAQNISDRLTWIEPDNVVLVKEMFFIWLGCLQEPQLEYFDIWDEVCEDEVLIYYDSRCLLASEIENVICRIHQCTPEDTLFIQYQSDWFESYVESKENHLDEWLVEHTRDYDADVALELEFKLYRYRNRYYQLSKLVTLRDIASVKSLFIFNNTDLEPYYLYEVLLRNNLAAASDIIRLLILYHRGGMYVDFDTLPSFEQCFPVSNQRFPKSVKNNMVDVLKSELIMNVLRERQMTRFVRCQGNSQLIEDVAGTFFICEQDLVDSLRKEAEQVAEEQIFQPFSIPSVHKDGLALTRSKNTVGEFNNNVLIAHKESKVVRIILMMMISRYRYMERNGIIFDDLFSRSDNDVTSSEEREDYWQRFHHYRHDHLYSRDNVTLFLSGPSLVLETILSLAYEIFDIEGCNPGAVALAMSHPDLMVSFVQQTQFTSEHMRSTWQRNKNLFSR